MERLRDASLRSSISLSAAILAAAKVGEPAQSGQQSVKAGPTSQAPDEQKPAATLDPTRPALLSKLV